MIQSGICRSCGTHFLNITQSLGGAPRLYCSQGCRDFNSRQVKRAKAGLPPLPRCQPGGRVYREPKAAVESGKLGPSEIRRPICGICPHRRQDLGCYAPGQTLETWGEPAASLRNSGRCPIGAPPGVPSAEELARFARMVGVEA